MSKSFDDIKTGFKEAANIASGEVDPSSYRVFIPNEIDVKAIREHLCMSQTEFSARYGFSVGTVQCWEQGRRRPQGPARTLLTLINRIPDEVNRVLAGKDEKTKKPHAI